MRSDEPDTLHHLINLKKNSSKYLQELCIKLYYICLIVAPINKALVSVKESYTGKNITVKKNLTCSCNFGFLNNIFTMFHNVADFHNALLF